MKFSLIDPGLKVQYVPDPRAIETARQLGRKVGKALQDLG
jgi:hypothetical protein